MAEIKKVIKNNTTYDVFNSDNVDSVLNTSSTNAIQNGAVATALNTKITNPSGGTAGQILKKTANGEEWANESGLVTSVNGQTGAVTVQATLSNITSSEIKTGTATTQKSVTAAALAGAMPVLSTQANNILTSGAKIRAGTEANYQALATKDSNTVYLTI